MKNLIILASILALSCSKEQYSAHKEVVKETRITIANDRVQACQVITNKHVFTYTGDFEYRYRCSLLRKNDEVIIMENSHAVYWQY
jgi:nanoRNase/pAp phosphatase (c-di-AMP/oligoRNAs hydrolase)